jgi:hypothetical protein
MTTQTAYIVIVVGIVLLAAFCCAPQLSLTEPMMLYDAFPIVGAVVTAVRAKQRRAAGNYNKDEDLDIEQEEDDEDDDPHKK